MPTTFRYIHAHAPMIDDLQCSDQQLVLPLAGILMTLPSITRASASGRPFGAFTEGANIDDCAEANAAFQKSGNANRNTFDYVYQGRTQNWPEREQYVWKYLNGWQWCFAFCQIFNCQFILNEHDCYAFAGYMHMARHQFPDWDRDSSTNTRNVCENTVTIHNTDKDRFIL